MSEFLLSFAEHEAALKTILVIALVLIAAGILLRFLCHAIAGMPRAASACLAILVIYLLSLCLMGEQGRGGSFLGALPFLGEAADYPGVCALMKTDFDSFFTELSKLFVMAFFVNLAQDLLIRRRERNFFLWLLLEGIVAAGALLVNYGTDYLLRTYLPQGFADWLPVVVFCVIGVLLILALLKLIFRLLNPILGFVLGFFSGNMVGRTLTKGLLSTALLTAVAAATDRLGYGSALFRLTLSVETLLPAVAVLILLWYLVWRVLC